MSDVSGLVRMANQIADFFQSYPDDEAVPGIAGHIRDFWTPAMREKLGRYMAADGNGLRPLVIRAMRSLDSKAA